MKKMIIGFLLGGIIFGTIGVVASTTISSKNVTYQNKTVKESLDELYNNAVTGKELIAAAITNKGINTISSDTYEMMAANINSIDTNHSKFELLWENPNPTANFNAQTIELGVNPNDYQLIVICAIDNSILTPYMYSALVKDIELKECIGGTNHGWARLVEYTDSGIKFGDAMNPTGTNSTSAYAKPYRIWGVK